jgi:hypothetical protein
MLFCLNIKTIKRTKIANIKTQIITTSVNKNNFLARHKTTLCFTIYSYCRVWAKGWTIEVLGFDSRWDLGIFLFTTVSKTALGLTQPPIQWVPGALSLGNKAAGE